MYEMPGGGQRCIPVIGGKADRQYIVTLVTPIDRGGARRSKSYDSQRILCILYLIVYFLYVRDDWVFVLDHVTEIKQLCTTTTTTTSPAAAAAVVTTEAGAEAVQLHNHHHQLEEQ